MLTLHRGKRKRLIPKKKTIAVQSLSKKGQQQHNDKAESTCQNKKGSKNKKQKKPQNIRRKLWKGEKVNYIQNAKNKILQWVVEES